MIYMQNFAPHIYTFILPLFVTNVVHMLVVKLNLLAATARPVSQRLFGYGKTWRAFIVMPLVCAIACMLFRAAFFPVYSPLHSSAIGATLGLAYLVGELPNSFLKRRLGIPSGQKHPRYLLLQSIIDKCDSLLVACLAYSFLATISLAGGTLLFVASFVIHVIFSWLLVQLRIKKSF